MKLTKIVIPVLSVIGIVGLVSPAFAEPTAPTPLAEKPDNLGKATPFRGKVEAVDPTAQTVTVAGKLIHITASTNLTKIGKPITLGDIAVGDEVHGMTRTSDEGKNEAAMLVVSPASDKYDSDK